MIGCFTAFNKKQYNVCIKEILKIENIITVFIILIESNKRDTTINAQYFNYPSFITFPTQFALYVSVFINKCVQCWCKLENLNKI